MAILFLELNILENYKFFLKDILKYLTVLIVFQYLLSANSKLIKNPFSTKFLNNSFLYLIIFIILGLMVYYLIVEELIDII